MAGRGRWQAAASHSIHITPFLPLRHAHRHSPTPTSPFPRYPSSSSAELPTHPPHTLRHPTLPLLLPSLPFFAEREQPRERKKKSPRIKLGGKKEKQKWKKKSPSRSHSPPPPMPPPPSPPRSPRRGGGGGGRQPGAPAAASCGAAASRGGVGR